MVRQLRRRAADVIVAAEMVRQAIVPPWQPAASIAMNLPTPVQASGGSPGTGTQAGKRPGRCGALMERSGEPCARIDGHNGVHMNAEQIARKQAWNKEHASATRAILSTQSASGPRAGNRISEG